MRIKLSPAQLHVMFELKKGAVVHYIGGLNPYWFLSKELHHLNYQTIFKLADLGLIEEKNEHGFNTVTAILTDKGRTYLDEISKPNGRKVRIPSDLERDDQKGINTV